MPLVYQELRRIAQHHISGQAPGPTLQPTALIHEAFVKLIGAVHPRAARPKAEAESKSPHHR